NGSSAGEYTYSLFVVIAASLLVSWIVAVLFAPLIGVALLPKTMKGHHEKPGRLTGLFVAVLRTAMRWRWTTVLICIGLM
ncbi:efflux RND transporter permease subunit, partial [Klebsiella aerogenes]